MSILIKGMEMPETCKLCPLSEFDAGFYAFECRPTGARIDYEMAKISKPQRICPLVHVPPHGRLIDGDIAEVISFEDADAEGKDFADGVLYAVDFISQMPTIIPAEEET